MGFNFLDPAWENTRERNERNLFRGVGVAIVTDNNDTEGLYRVKVKYPWLSNSDDESAFWARIATFGAGKDRGMFCLPEVGDEVLVAFEHADFQHPIVIGSLWDGVETTHLDNKSQSGKNNKRTFKSRSGHVLEFNDDGDSKKESVTIKTNGGHVLVLDDTSGALKIQAKTSDGQNQLTMDETGKKITMQTDSGDIVIKAKNTVHIEGMKIETKSNADTSMDVGGSFSMKATSTMSMTTSATGTIEATGTLTIKGAMVNIN